MKKTISLFRRDYKTRLVTPDCELVGPKVQGNPYALVKYTLFPHGDPLPLETPRDFEGLRKFLEANEIEGIVWHHPDGRMVKVKKKDFGLEWPP